jgi:predicted Fe-Mo cluster-binding NifX family protein
MKICITSTGTDLDAPVDLRFGRCAFFLFVDTDNGKSKAVENPGVSASSGAGIQAGQLIASEGAEVLLTGNIGPNAYRVLETAGISVMTGIAGTGAESLARFKNDELTPLNDSSVAAHHGMGGGQGAGRNPRSGAGQGAGQGRNMGSGGGQGAGRNPRSGAGQGAGQGRNTGSGGGRGAGQGRGSGQDSRSGRGNGQGGRRGGR